MQVEKDYDLTKLNTFGIPAKARYFTCVKNESDIEILFALPEFKASQKLFLGGGSNVLLTQDFNGFVVLNQIKGIEVIKEDEGSTTIKAYGGEVWHDLVLFSVERGYWGIENLSLIPGSVGAAPMQNIGAYGAELSQVLVMVEAVNIETGEKRIFNREECELGYRDSVFKNTLKDKYFILSITLTLSKKEKKNISYKVLKEHLENNNIIVESSKDVSDAVEDIRRSKLPDPEILGNAGSFFKNVFIPKEKLEELLKTFPDMPHFAEREVIKIPAAWLIEQAGFKGKRKGNAGVHEKQALVLVNHGGATGEEITGLAREIIAAVEHKFGLKLTPEVNLI